MLWKRINFIKLRNEELETIFTNLILHLLQTLNFLYASLICVHKPWWTRGRIVFIFLYIYCTLDNWNLIFDIWVRTSRHLSFHLSRIRFSDWDHYHLMYGSTLLVSQISNICYVSNSYVNILFTNIIFNSYEKFCLFGGNYY